jgi:hypothetical protein
MPPRTALRTLIAGTAGTAAMTASTAIEMRIRGRPASTAPVEAAERATGITLPSDDARRALSWAAHLPFGIGMAAARPALARALPSAQAAAAAFAALAWLPDLAVVPALGATPPPWRWGAAELAISGLHHAVYAAGVETAWRAAA